ncbi:NAD(P)H-dependent oxidoreductase [Neisseria chenwenguii]|uniref:NAD(P)H-dependent oxidoreductase n=1 Tax=Neisseria chenwenguii TaxID=1853278 RepID=UPI000F4F3DB1|nr:NAD(P)H-dependent oxidoreductase [Neisseria chenwenguii]ROV54417.1 NAD(P)H-dependent oxidoreductase [Neisseria chenwenguii]
MFTLNRDDVFKAFQNRQSTRRYLADKKISEDDFRYILELGRLSPSSVGSEPWQFLVVQNRELREKMKPFSWGMASQLDAASHLVIFLARKNQVADAPAMLESIRRRKIPAEQLDATIAKYRDFQENDTQIAQNPRTLFDWCSKQTYIALANMMTGAALIGIDSCPIEGFHYGKMNDLLAAEGLMNPEEWGVSVAATFGYRNGDIERKARRKLDDVVQWVK